MISARVVGGNVVLSILLVLALAFTTAPGSGSAEVIHFARADVFEGDNGTANGTEDGPEDGNGTEDGGADNASDPRYDSASGKRERTPDSTLELVVLFTMMVATWVVLFVLAGSKKGSGTGRK